MPLCNVCMCTLSRLFIILAYFFALLNNVAFNNIVEFAKSQIELMSEKMMKLIGEKKANPFQFKHLKLCHSMAKVNNVPTPKVGLASMPDMKCGFSHLDLGQRSDYQWCRQNHPRRGEEEDQAVRAGTGAVQGEGEKFQLQAQLQSCGRSLG